MQRGPKAWLAAGIVCCLPSAAAQELPQRQVTFLQALAAELELQCQRSPQDVALWVRLGSVRTQLGELDSALQALARAQEVQPKDPEIRAQTAYVRSLGGDPKASLLELRRLAEQSPEAPGVLYYLGIAQDLGGESAAAERALEKAHRLKPQDLSMTLAYLRVRHQRAPAAELESAYRELFNQAPQNYEVRYEYALTLLDSNKPIAAVSIARPLIEQYPDWVKGHVLLARAYWAAEDFISTVFELEHLPLQKLDAESCLLLGRGKARLGQSEDALRYLDLALRKRPGFIAAQREIATIYLQSGLEREAEKIIKSILAASPNDYDARGLLAYLLQANGEFDRAIQILDKLAEMDPSRSEAFEGLGYIALKRADYRSAVGHLQEALKRSPRNALVCDQVGQAFAKLGDPQNALFYLRRSIEIDPRRSEPHYMLGQLLARLGRKDEAKKELATAQELGKQARRGTRGGMALAPTVPQ